MTHFFNLTPGTDTFTGVSGDDNAFQLTPATLQSTDTVTGGATGAFIDVLVVTATGTIAGSQFTGVTNIEQLNLFSGGNNVTLTNGLVAGTSLGNFVVLDGGGNDTIDASAVSTKPIVFYAADGSDTFKGGGGNDAIVIAAANLTSADTIQGGAGIDNLYFSTAGTVAASAFTNVSGIEGIGLSSLGNNITLTNAMVASSNNGGFAVADGAGNDTVDASGVTNGTAIAFFASGGADTFKGGNGSNGYVFVATDLTSADTVQGGTGASDNLFITTAGTLSAAAFTNVTGIEGLVLANGTNNVTLTNGLVAGTALGYFAVSGGTGDDTVNASAVTNGTAIAFYGTTGGNDAFTGGNGNDSFLFAAGQLTAADTVVGGGGNDTLWMTTAGTTSAAALAGVTGIEGVFLQVGGTFNLANGITGAASFAAVGSSAVDTFDASAVTGYKVTFAGNGGADVLKGGSQDDTFFIADSAFASINGNGGIDRITLTAASQSFNLTANAAKISNLEVIDLNSSFNSTLTLAGTDIALVNASGTSLYVVGDVDDTVNAGTGYTQIASGVVNNAVAPGHTFFEYQYTNGSLLFIDSAITAQTATTSNGSASVPEGTAAGATVFNAGMTGAISYVLGGADAALFSIDGTGHISFNASPDFETPHDQGTNNVYDVTVTSSNGTATPNFVQTVAITVTDINDNAPVFNSGAAATTPENVATTTPVYTAHATDADASSTVSYALASGGDNNLFDINSATGAVTFKASPDFENPQDAGHDNTYDIGVIASDGVPAHDTTKAVAITVTDLNEAPAITSNGGGDTASVSVNENSTAVTTVTATDPDVPAQTLAYSVLTGADSPDGAKFTIDGSGHLSFISAPDFEAPGSAASSNAYTVQVQVADSGVPTMHDIQTITVNVQDANDIAPTFTSSATPTVVENTTAVVDLTTTDPDTVGTNPATFSINAGLDGALFTITGGNHLAFVAPRDYETQAHSYTLDVTASDGINTTIQHITVALADANDNAPIFSSGTTASTPENVATNVAVYTAIAPDADGTAANNTVTYTLASGGDNDLFNIDSTSGAVTFKASPDFEAPADAGGDNVYDISVTASDGLAAHDATQAVAITVTDVNDNAPVFGSPTGTATVDEATSTSTVVFDASATDADGTPANNTISYSLGGTDVAHFNINSATGEVTFAAVPNFEAPADAGADNHYDITVTASDGVPAHDATQAVTITVADLAPSAPTDSDGGSNQVFSGEPAGGATGVHASSTDPATGTVTYALLDDTGAVADAGGRFTIDPSTGVVTVSGTTPIVFDSGNPANNDLVITVRASDPSGMFSSSDFHIAVQANQAPVIDSDGGGDDATLSFAENATTPVTTVHATDPDNAPNPTVSYSIVPGNDGAAFTIDASTGDLSFVTAPDFEHPTDSDTNNSYVVVVRASDGAATDDQTITVNVTNVNEAPVNTVPGPQSTAEDTPKAISGVTIADDSVAVTTTLSVLHGGVSVTAGGGAAISNNNTGTVTVSGTVTQVNAALTGLTYSNTPDYNGTDTLTVVTSDGALSDSKTVALTVTPVVDIANDTATTNEDTPVNIDVNANDTFENAGHAITAVNGSAIAVNGTVNIVNGAVKSNADGTLTFTPSANYNGPASFTYTVTSGGVAETATVNVTVNSVNDAPTFTTSASTTSTEDAGAQSVSNFATAISAGPADEAGQTVTFNVTGNTNAGLFSVAPSIAANGTLTYTAAPNANGTATITVVGQDNGGTANGGVDTSASHTFDINVTAVNDAPVNTVPAAQDAIFARTATAITGLSVSDVDSGAGETTVLNVQHGTLNVASIGGAAVVTNNGTATVTLTGTAEQIATTLSATNGVVYTSGAFTGTDVLTVTTNDNGATGTGAHPNVVSTENLGIIPKVWFIDNSASAVGADGSQGHPFNSIAAFNAINDGGAGHAQANDYIYLKTGTGVYSETDGIHLLNGQQLIGGGDGLTFPDPLHAGTLTIETAGTRPVIDVTGGAGNDAIHLAQDNTIHGFNVATENAAAAGIVDNGGTVGTLNISNMDVGVDPDGAGALHGNLGQAISITHGGTGGSMTFGSVSSGGGTTGIALGGTLATNFSATGGTLSGHSTSEVAISGGSGTVSYGGTIGDGSGLSASVSGRTAGTVTLSGNINDGNDLGGGITVSGNTGGTIDFTGTTKTLNTGTGNAVSLSSNTGATIDFTGGGLDIDTTSGTGFSANTGTVTVTGLGNTINTTSGTALSLSNLTVGSNGVTFDSASTTSAATAISIDTVTGGAINVNGGTIAGATTRGVDINAVQNNVTIASSIGSTGGHSVEVTNSGKSGGNTILLSGAITDTGGGINLDNNDQNGGVATVNFTGALNIDSTVNTGFNATNGGTVNATNAANSLNTTTGTALNVANTTIGSSNLIFHDISANGAVNGIVLNTTGSSGHLTVTGSNSVASAIRDNSGGTIQSTTGAGISLTNTTDAAFNNVNIQSTGDSGVNGTQVTNFSFTNGTINNAGNAGHESAIAFNTSPGTANNIAGTLTMTGNSITNAFYGGLDIESSDGTVSNATISGNTITNPGFSGVNIVGTGTSTTAFNINNATIANNNITSSGGNGIQVNVGNSSTSGPGAHAGFVTIDGLGRPTSDASHIISITGNSISLDGTGTQAIAVSNTGANSASRTQTNFEIKNNGTVATPLSGSLIGSDILIGNNGYSDMAGVVDNNVIDAHHTAGTAGGGGNGIAGGNGVAGAGNAFTPRLDLAVTNNTISDTNGSGILLVSRGATGTAFLKVASNTVAAPNDTGGFATNGIEVDAGNNPSADDAVFLNIFGNTSAGTNGALGIGLYKQGNVATTNDFGIFDAPGGPTLASSPTNAQVEAFLASLNSSTVEIFNGSNFIRDTTLAPALNAAAGGVQASSPTPGETHLTQAQLDSVVAAAIGQWAAAGATAAQLAALHATTFSVSNLSDNTIGEQTPGHITIDADAAGHGWFVDPTPNDNSEFTHAQNAAGTDLLTDPSNAAAGHLDLLTTVTHELGHVLGLDDVNSPTDDLMYIDLVDGERRLPDAADVVEAKASGANQAEAALPVSAQAAANTPIVVGTSGNDTIDAGHGGNILFGGAGADNFVFGSGIQLNAPTPAQVTHVADYHAAEGDTFDFSAITSAFHNSGVNDSLVVRAVEDASGKFATLQVDHIDPMGLPSAPVWVNVAQLDGAHSGDAVNVLIDSHSSVHLAQIHVDLLV